MSNVITIVVPLLILSLSFATYIIGALIENYLKFNKIYTYLILGFIFGVGGLHKFSELFHIFGNTDIFPTYNRYLLFSTFILTMYISFKVFNDKLNSSKNFKLINIILIKGCEFVIVFLFSYLLLKDSVDIVLLLSTILSLSTMVVSFDFNTLKPNSFINGNAFSIANKVIALFVIVTTVFYIGSFSLLFQSIQIAIISIVVAMFFQFLNKNISDKINVGKLNEMFIAVSSVFVLVILISITSYFYVETTNLILISYVVSIVFGAALAKFNFGKVNNKFQKGLYRLNNYFTIPIIFTSVTSYLYFNMIFNKQVILILLLILVEILISSYIYSRVSNSKINKVVEMNSNRGLSLIIIAIIFNLISLEHFEFFNSMVIASIIILILNELIKIYNIFLKR